MSMEYLINTSSSRRPGLHICWCTPNNLKDYTAQPIAYCNLCGKFVAYDDARNLKAF